MVNFLKKSVQQKVLMSFHFLPQICGEKQEILKYETERNGIIAKEIVDKAVKNLYKKEQ